MKKSLLVVAMAIFASPAMADWAGGSSNVSYVMPGPGVLEGSGVGIAMPDNHDPDTGPAPDSLTDVVSFREGPIDKTNLALSNAASGNGYITIGTTTISETWKHTITSGVGKGTEVYAYRQINPPLPNYPHFGGEVVAKVHGQEVYFGEWAPWNGSTGVPHSTDLNMDDDRRTVFYVGENPTASMPNMTNVSYDVVGIKKYNPDTQAGMSVSTLNVNFNSTSVAITGTLGGVDFSGTNVSSNGSFTNGSTITGQFYGNSAEALAGMYNTTGVDDDMAFGGLKTSLRP